MTQSMKLFLLLALASSLQMQNAKAELQGDSNTFYGIDAGAATLDDNDNATFIGRAAGMSNTTGARNTFVGYGAGSLNTEGSDNTMMGFNAGSAGNGGEENILIGVDAGVFNQGHDNLFIGNRAGVNNETYSDFNVFLGNESGYANHLGSKNTFIGYKSGTNNYSGENNVFVGYKTGYSNSTGNYNVIQGYEAGYNLIDGWHNVMIGHNAGYNINGSSNVLIGPWAGENLDQGAGYAHSNTFVGVSAGRLNQSGGNNVFIGGGAGYEHLSGGYNTMVGRNAGYTNASGAWNVFLGHQAGYYEQGSERLHIGNHRENDPLIYGEFDNERVRIHGDLDVTGNLTKGSGSFVQPHPSDPSKEVVYAFFEGPEHAIFLRGKASLVDGQAVINPPESFRVVAGKDEDITIQLTPRSTETFGLAATQVSKDTIVIEELRGETHSYEFDYFITAKRAGFEAHQPIQENTHFSADQKRAKAFEKKYANKENLTIAAMRTLLIANGILNEDGKLNQDTVTKLGWDVLDPDGEQE